MNTQFFRVELDDHYSSIYHIDEGVPKGSVLGPLCLPVFINAMSCDIISIGLRGQYLVIGIVPSTVDLESLKSLPDTF